MLPNDRQEYHLMKVATAHLEQQHGQQSHCAFMDLCVVWHSACSADRTLSRSIGAVSSNSADSCPPKPTRKIIRYSEGQR
jgi:hypothetical protein